MEGKFIILIKKRESEEILGDKNFSLSLPCVHNERKQKKKEFLHICLAPINS